MLTEREKEILKVIKENPLVSQEEIAKKLSITRSSIAVHISNIMKKGYIIGKGYLINEDPYILSIGGANVDIQGYSYSPIKPHDSNPGKVSVSYGGVAKNIIDNIARMGVRSKFITILGDDMYGEQMKNYLIDQNIDISESLFPKNQSTSTYLSVLDSNRDMSIAIASMDIFKVLTREHLERRSKSLEYAQAIVTDTNLEADTLKYITSFKDKTRIILDPVSTKKAMKIIDFIGDFHTIKPNKIEAEALSGIKISNENDLTRIGNFFLEKGVENIFISLGSDGVFYMNKSEKGCIKSEKISPKNVTGAGDALTAGIAYGIINDFSLKETAKFAAATSIITLLDRNSVSKNVSLENIYKTIEEMKL